MASRFDGSVAPAVEPLKIPVREEEEPQHDDAKNFERDLEKYAEEDQSRPGMRRKAGGIRVTVVIPPKLEDKVRRAVYSRPRSRRISLSAAYTRGLELWLEAEKRKENP